MLKRLLMWFLFVAGVLTLAVILFLQQPLFGKAASGERLKQMQASPRYKNGRFENTRLTPALTEGASYIAVLREFLFRRSKRGIPAVQVPSVKTDLHQLPADKNIIVWFGHSSYYMQIDGKRILADPVFSGNASPIGSTGSFKGSDVYTTDDIPPIDYLFISHDHYDHLDYKTIRKLKDKTGKVITGLGTGAHLEYWGFAPENILEGDWNTAFELAPGFKVTLLPARHFSGRSFKRNTTLWVSFALQTPTLKIYMGGDSGYDTHFAEIGTQYGPFDLAILECGQYDKSWKYIHMMPEEVATAASDLKASVLMPVHWGKFQLGNHDWDDPILRVTARCREMGIPYVTPLIGAPLVLGDSITENSWWKDLK